MISSGKSERLKEPCQIKSANFTSVYWRLMFRVKSQAKYEKCLAKILPLLGNGATATEGKPYWKIPGIWESTVTVPAPAGSVAEVIFNLLSVAFRLGSGWYISGLLTPNSATGFSGVLTPGKNGCVSDSILGLEWASFDLC